MYISRHWWSDLMGSNVVVEDWRGSDHCTLCCNSQMCFQCAKTPVMPSLWPEKCHRGGNNRRPRGTFGSCCGRLGSSRFVCRGRICLLEYRCWNQWIDLWGKTCNRLWRIYLVRSSRCRLRIFYNWFRLCCLGIDRLGRVNRFHWHCRTVLNHIRCRWPRRLLLSLYLIHTVGIG